LILQAAADRQFLNGLLLPHQSRWTSKTRYMQLRIDPLTAESARELLRSLLGADPSLQPLVPLLINQTEGNPFVPRGKRARPG
jgi:predicted ATPase